MYLKLISQLETCSLKAHNYVPQLVAWHNYLFEQGVLLPREILEKSGKAEGFTCQIRVVPLLNTNKQNQSEITFTAKVLVQFSSQFFWECGDEFRAFTDKKGEIDGEEELNLTEKFGQAASFFSKFKLCFSVIYKKNAIKVI